ncbi:hypothetical protein HDE_00773 [Halotydeus destructor]|nr:hypothetical protein HDE_00773 [Halotydeus destructor]
MASSDQTSQTDDVFNALMNEICLEYALPRSNLFLVAQEFIGEDASSRFDDDPVAVKGFEENQERVRKLLQQDHMQAKSNASSEQEYSVKLRNMLSDPNFDKKNTDQVSELLNLLRKVSDDRKSEDVDMGKLRTISTLEGKIHKLRQEQAKENAEFEKELFELERLKRKLAEVNRKNHMADEMLTLIKNHFEDNQDRDFGTMWLRWSSSNNVPILVTEDLNSTLGITDDDSAVSSSVRKLRHREQFIKVTLYENGVEHQLASTVASDLILDKYMAVDSNKILCLYCTDPKCDYADGILESEKNRRDVKIHLIKEMRLTYGCNVCKHVQVQEKHKIDQHIKYRHANIVANGGI